jgi:hypothetical protein
MTSLRKALLTAVVAAFTLSTSQAFARAYDFHGTICEPTGTTPLSELIYGDWGVAAVAGLPHPVNVRCPMPISFNRSVEPTVTRIAVMLGDSDRADNSRCTVRKTDHLGGYMWDKTVNTSMTTSVKVFDFAIDPGLPVDGFWYMDCILIGWGGGVKSPLASIYFETTE